MTKSTKCMCAQRRLRSAWASSQSISQLCSKWEAKDASFFRVDSEDSDQTWRSLRKAHMPFCRFCHTLTQFLIFDMVSSIVTAFILDMFIYEYTFCKKGSIDTKVEATIKSLQLGIDDET